MHNFQLVKGMFNNNQLIGCKISVVLSV